MVGAPAAEQDLRLVGDSNHLSSDAGVGANGTDAGIGFGNIGIGQSVLASSTTSSHIEITEFYIFLPFILLFSSSNCTLYLLLLSGFGDSQTGTSFGECHQHE